MNKIKLIALVGRSSAGKNTIQTKLCELIENSNRVVSCTTRPRRDTEEDGREYYFIDLPTFTQLLLQGNLIEAASYNHNNWFYGTSINALEPDKINIGIFNPTAIECIKDDPRLDIQIIYIYCPDKLRLLRSLSREHNPDCREICRRFLSEDDTYGNLEEEDNFIMLDNSTVSPNYEELLSKLDNFIK